MKKWSISLIVVTGLLCVAAFALPTMAAAAPGPYCPGPGQPYKPCETTPPSGGGGGGGTTEPPKTCAAGQTGTYPNCVTPTVDVSSVKVQPNSSTITLTVNAPGKIKVSGKGIASTTVSVTPGNVKIKVKLTKAEKEKLKEKGKLTLKVTVTYTPTGGTPVTKTIKITVKAPQHKSGKGGK
jgi:hypothetical protein